MSSKKKGVAKAIFYYWILVILWQTFRPVENRSLLDSLVKAGLLSIVLFYGVKHKNTRHTSNISALFSIFLVTQAITIFSDSITTGTMITNVFMMVEIVVFVIWLHNERITTEELEWFAVRVVFVAVIMGAYSILFKTERFIRAFTSAGAYGSECKSFLYSNHEFALYTATAIVFSVWLHFTKRVGSLKFACLVGFLAVNLISALSRTALLGCIIAVSILSLAAGKKYFSRVALAGLAVFAIAMTNEGIREFVFGKVLKGSIEESGSIMDQGRAAMYQSEWWYFLNGTLMQKLFGHGYAGNQAGGHDAYLVILNTGGIVMFLFFMILLFRCLKVTIVCARIDKLSGALCIGLQTMVLMYMVAQTPILFYSSMDAFFITAIFVMIPLYTMNNLRFITEPDQGEQ